jgi:hypothetical protein
MLAHLFNPKPVQTHIAVLPSLLAFDLLHTCFPHLEEGHALENHLINIKLFIRSNATHSLYPIYHICFMQSPPVHHIVTPPDASIYNNAITAPTTPNNPTPTFTVPAALFPLVVAPAALPLLVPVPVELADVLVVFAPLALPVLVVLALTLALVLALPVADPEDEPDVVEGIAEETVLVESIENWFE